MIESIDKLARAAATFMDELEDDFGEHTDVKVADVGIAVELRWTEDGQERTEVGVYCTQDNRVYQRGLFDEAYDRAVDRGDLEEEET